MYEELWNAGKLRVARIRLRVSWTRVEIRVRITTRLWRMKSTVMPKAEMRRQVRINRTKGSQNESMSDLNKIMAVIVSIARSKADATICSASSLQKALTVPRFVQHMVPLLLLKVCLSCDARAHL